MRKMMQKVRVAAVLTWIYAAAFGVPAVPVSVYLLQHGDLPMFMDLFRMYGGPWDVIGDWAFVTLLMGFLVVLLAAAWAAWLAWKGLRAGVVLGLAILPVEAVFWLGFALPIPWLFGLTRGVLYVLAWKSVRQHHGSITAG
jgi:hypothetical protein